MNSTFKLTEDELRDDLLWVAEHIIFMSRSYNDVTTQSAVRDVIKMKEILADYLERLRRKNNE